MGQTTSHEQLVLRWTELCADPRWDDFPGKIELNGLGVIEMSPATNRHGMQHMTIGSALTLQLPDGTAFIEGGGFTTDGVRVPDVAWASAALMAWHGDVAPFPRAPEICVEVGSPSNTDAETADETELFLQAGVIELWIADEAGGWQRFSDGGARADSPFSVVLV